MLWFMHHHVSINSNGGLLSGRFKERMEWKWSGEILQFISVSKKLARVFPLKDIERN